MGTEINKVITFTIFSLFIFIPEKISPSEGPNPQESSPSPTTITVPPSQPNNSQALLYDGRNQVIFKIYLKENCSICLEDLPTKFSNLRILACGHTFCKNCLPIHTSNPYLLRCPNCRQAAHSKLLTKPEKKRLSNILQQKKREAQKKHKKD